jgi:hypothetical protein
MVRLLIIVVRVKKIVVRVLIIVVRVKKIVVRVLIIVVRVKRDGPVAHSLTPALPL